MRMREKVCETELARVRDSDSNRERERGRDNDLLQSQSAESAKKYVCTPENNSIHLTLFIRFAIMLGGGKEWNLR